MYISTESKLDFHSAVNYCIDMSRSHANFFVDTQFGTIPVELNYRYMGDTLVTVDDWATTEVTKFIAHNRHGHYDYIVRINFVRGQDSSLTKAEFVVALATVLLKRFIGSYISCSDKKVMALTYAYAEVYYMSTDASSYAKSYIDAHNKMARFSSKNYAMIMNMSTDKFRSIIWGARESFDSIISKIKDPKGSVYSTDFGNHFYDVLMYICLQSIDHECIYNRKMYNSILEQKVDIPFKLEAIDFIKYLINEIQKERN